MNISAVMFAVLITGVQAMSPTYADSDTCLQQAQQAINNQQLQHAEQIVRAHLKHNSDDSAAQFMLARIWGWQKHYTQSLAAFNQLLAKHTNNSDYLLARARLHEWMGNDALALADLQQAREVSPDYLDVWLAQARLMSRQNTDNETQISLQNLLQQATLRFPQQDWQQWQPVQSQPQQTAGQYALASSAGRDNLSNNRAAWKQASVVLSGRTEHGSGHVQIDSFDRFNLNDWQLAGGFSMPLSSDWSFTFNGSISPTARVIARNRVEAIISKQLDGGLNIHTGLQYANFATTDSQQLHITAEYYWSHYRFAYTYRAIHVDNAGTGHNQRAVISTSYDATNSVSFALASGKDVEYDGTATPPVSDVSTLSLYGRHALQADTSLTWSLTHHKQGTFYKRNGFTLGAQFDF